jgi:two-component system chemotaxis response regulator CheB
LGDVYGASALALILSGMGRDGAIGARRLAELGGEILAQDAESSVVWGMPGSVVRAGIAALVASPAALADRVAAREKPGRGAADTPAWN